MLVFFFYIHKMQHHVYNEKQLTQSLSALRLDKLNQ